MTRPTQAALIAGGLLCAALFVAAWRFGGDLAPLSGTRKTWEGASASDPFPRTARDIHGFELTLAGPPESLASQALVTDHFLFAVVPHERIVGVSAAAHDPRYSFVADIVSRMDVVVTSDPEAVLRRKPELMLVAESARADYVEMTRASGVPVFRMRTVAENFGQIAKGLETTGYLTGEDAAADREIGRLRERVRAARARRPADAPPPRVLAFSSFSYTYGEGSLFDHIVTALGAVNVGAEQGIGPYGSISSEHVASWNPDWIVCAGEPDSIESVRERLLADPGVTVTAAGRERQILVVENRRYLSMSQHAVGLMEALAVVLYPEAK
ncbi:MAG: ABC transporter substrate-binding protein [Acidobacteriota bacterium]|nr:ABC transporter substrate-binding protein [Acidobacteriota bacterium]